MSTHVRSILTAREEFVRCLGKAPTRVLLNPETLYETKKETLAFQHCEDLSASFRVCGLIAVNDPTLAYGEVLVE